MDDTENLLVVFLRHDGLVVLVKEEAVEVANKQDSSTLPAYKT